MCHSGERDIYNEGGHACWGQWVHEKALYHFLNLTVKLKLLQKIVFKKYTVNLSILILKI